MKKLVLAFLLMVCLGLGEEVSAQFGPGGLDGKWKATEAEDDRERFYLILNEDTHFFQVVVIDEGSGALLRASAKNYEVRDGVLTTTLGGEWSEFVDRFSVKISDSGRTLIIVPMKDERGLPPESVPTFSLMNYQRIEK